MLVRASLSKIDSSCSTLDDGAFVSRRNPCLYYWISLYPQKSVWSYMKLLQKDGQDLWRLTADPCEHEISHIQSHELSCGNTFISYLKAFLQFKQFRGSILPGYQFLLSNPLSVCWIMNFYFYIKEWRWEISLIVLHLLPSVLSIQFFSQVSRLYRSQKGLFRTDSILCSFLYAPAIFRNGKPFHPLFYSLFIPWQKLMWKIALQVFSQLSFWAESKALVACLFAHSKCHTANSMACLPLSPMCYFQGFNIISSSLSIWGASCTQMTGSIHQAGSLLHT